MGRRQNPDVHARDREIKVKTNDTTQPAPVYICVAHLRYVINNAHHQGVTAIACTSDCNKIISGGGEGQVRVWNVIGNSQSLAGAMKEHKSSITCIKVRSLLNKYQSAPEIMRDFM